MNTKRTMLLGLWGIWGAATAEAQIAAYDTSLIVKGNTWLYARDEERRSTGSVTDGRSGLTRYEIDSVARAGDQIRFRVIHTDSLRSKLKYGPHPDSMEYRHTLAADTLMHAVTVQGQAVTTLPFFLIGQEFSSADTLTVYEGDTVRYRNVHSGRPTDCIRSGSQNLQGVGRTYQYDGHGGCGMSSSWNTWTLLEFRGKPYLYGAFAPVSTAGSHPGLRRQVSGTQLFRHRGGVFHGRDGKTFDLRGQRAGAFSKGAPPRAKETP